MEKHPRTKHFVSINRWRRRVELGAGDVTVGLASRRAALAKWSCTLTFRKMSVG